jgi:hypothetical protein
LRFLERVFLAVFRDEEAFVSLERLLVSLTEGRETAGSAEEEELFRDAFKRALLRRVCEATKFVSATALVDAGTEIEGLLDVAALVVAAAVPVVSAALEVGDSDEGPGGCAFWIFFLGEVLLVRLGFRCVEGAFSVDAALVVLLSFSVEALLAGVLKSIASLSEEETTVAAGAVAVLAAMETSLEAEDSGCRRAVFLSLLRVGGELAFRSDFRLARGGFFVVESFVG